MNRDILSLADRPIPELGDARRNRCKSRSYPIWISHPLGGEPLVDIGDFGIAGESYYHLETGNPPYDGRIEGSIPDILLRLSVVRRLWAVNRRLRNAGLGLHVFDGYRSVAFQDHMYLVWMPAYVRSRHPEWDAGEVVAETTTYWARGSDPDGRIDLLSPPPHSTGGAVDLTLRSLDTGMLLPMGAAFDDFSESRRAFTDHLERARSFGLTLTADERVALRNRRILYWVMIENGFANNPNEIWHFDLYDQLWAAVLDRGVAYYSMAFAPFL